MGRVNVKHDYVGLGHVTSDTHNAPLSFITAHHLATTMTLYELARDGLIAMRGTLPIASQNAGDAEQWARKFSEHLVRLLYHTHHILPNAMNVEDIDRIWKFRTRYW